MMTQVNKGLGPRAKCLRQQSGHSPISDISMVKRRFKHFILQKQPLVTLQFVVDLLQGSKQQFLTPAKISVSGIIRPIRQPKGKIDRKSTRLNSSHVRISYAV